MENQEEIECVTENPKNSSIHLSAAVLAKHFFKYRASKSVDRWLSYSSETLVHVFVKALKLWNIPSGYASGKISWSEYKECGRARPPDQTIRKFRASKYVEWRFHDTYNSFIPVVLGLKVVNAQSGMMKKRVAAGIAEAWKSLKMPEIRPLKKDHSSFSWI